MFCLLSFMYIYLQRERKTAKWVGIDFHQPCPCSELCPRFPPAASKPMCSAAASCCHMCAAPACWWDADVVTASAHATSPPRALRRSAQLSTAWAANGTCPGISSSAREMRRSRTGQMWGFTQPLRSLPWGREGALAHRLCLSSP